MKKESETRAWVMPQASCASSMRASTRRSAVTKRGLSPPGRRASTASGRTCAWHSTSGGGMEGASACGRRRGAGGAAAGLLEEGHGVAVDYVMPGDGGHARPRRHDADEVQRIARRHAQDLAVGLLASDRAQRLQRLGRRELLAHEPAHDAAAAQLPAHLEPT